MAEEQEWNRLGNMEKYMIASKAVMNGSALSREGNQVDLMNCGVDTLRISTLGDYLAKRQRDEKPITGKGFDDAIRDDEKLSRIFVIPVTLPSGEELEVIVNQKGQDMACMYKDEEGQERTFQLTPRMRKEIDNVIPNGLEKVIGIEVVQKEFLPQNLEEFAEKVSKDELVPKSNEDALKRVNLEKDGKKEKEETQRQEEIEENSKEIPEDIRDEVVKICEENGYHISDLKQVMKVDNPRSISGQLSNSGILENGGAVHCLRFRGKEIEGQDRIIMKQDGRAPIDDRRYDKTVTDLMDDKKAKRVYNLEDNDFMIDYTDIDGNTFVETLGTQNQNLKAVEKEELERKLANLDKLQESELSSAETEQDVARIYKETNQRRLSILKDYGIEMPEIEGEMQADNQIAEEIEEEEERDPRETNHSMEKNLY